MSLRKSCPKKDLCWNLSLTYKSEQHFNDLARGYVLIYRRTWYFNNT